jgi:phosphoglycerate dehydrogenase-like enzyme
MPLTIWTNTPLPDESLLRLRAAVVPASLLVSAQSTNILQAAGPDPLLASADIAFGQPDPAQLMTLTNLKWLHLSTAGYARYDRPDVRQFLADKKILFTNSSSVFDEPCAEHALAFMLSAARDLPSAEADQHGPRTWPQQTIRARSRLLTGQSALILGFGAIGRLVAKLLQPFQMNLHAVRRNPHGIDSIPVHPSTELDNLLPRFDHVINILPASPETNQLFNAERFARMKPGSVFYNLGRGTTVDQAALVQALASKHLAGAYLDVTEPEPLPRDHPLWTAPNCHITPHTAGGHENEFERGVDHFLENLKRFGAHEPLFDQVFK